jgi:dienelactone hydrolase
VRGKIRPLDDINVYESRPPNGLAKGTLIMLPDGFGLAQHNLRLADMFAERGWTTLVPDYFEGEYHEAHEIRTASDLCQALTLLVNAR